MRSNYNQSAATMQCTRRTKPVHIQASDYVQAHNHAAPTALGKLGSTLACSFVTALTSRSWSANSFAARSSSARIFARSARASSAFFRADLARHELWI